MSREEVMRLGEVIYSSCMVITFTVLFVGIDTNAIKLFPAIAIFFYYVYLAYHISTGPQKDKR